MKILYIDVNCHDGGSTGEIVYSLFHQALDNKLDPYIAYGRGQKLNEEHIFKFGLDIETFLHAFLTRITGYTGCFSYFSTKRLISYIKKVNPDVIHIHELHAYFVNIKQLLTFIKKRNIPTVFTNHCEFLYTGKCGHAKECDRYSKKCGKCPHLKEYPTSLFFDHTSKMLQVKRKIFENWNGCYFVSPSSWLDKKMDISFLASKPRFIVHNGINIDLYPDVKNEANKKEDKLVIAVAPNIMSNIKGGYRVIELAKMFENKHVNFLLVGSTSTLDIALPNNVKILPLIKDKKQLIDLYKCADAFLICSEFENFPTTCIEAQCVGLPVYGFDVGGVKETVLFNKEKNIVKYLDFAALYKAIDNGFKQVIDHEEISLVSKKTYSKEEMFANYLNIYKSILK